MLHNVFDAAFTSFLNIGSYASKLSLSPKIVFSFVEFRLSQMISAERKRSILKAMSRCTSLAVVSVVLASCVEADTSLISVQDRTKIGTLLSVFDRKAEKITANLSYIGNTQYLMVDDRHASLVSFRYVKESKGKQFYLVQLESPQTSNSERATVEPKKLAHKFEVMPLIIDSQNNLTTGTVHCDSNAVQSSKKNNINLRCSETLFKETEIVGEPHQDSLDCFFYDLFQGSSIEWSEAGATLNGYKSPQALAEIQCKL